MTGERMGLESPVLPIVVTVALLVECQQDSGAAYIIFPFTGEDMAVTGLRRHRWRKGIHRTIPLNRRLGATCCEQYADEQERGIALTPRQDDRP
jgi:hypothetical protein